MRCPSGILGSRLLFIVINVCLLVSWAVQLRDEDKMRWEEEVMEESEWWDGEVKRLEGLLAGEFTRLKLNFDGSGLIFG